MSSCELRSHQPRIQGLIIFIKVSTTPKSNGRIPSWALLRCGIGVPSSHEIDCAALIVQSKTVTLSGKFNSFANNVFPNAP